MKKILTTFSKQFGTMSPLRSPSLTNNTNNNNNNNNNDNNKDIYTEQIRITKKFAAGSTQLLNS
jgi:hypothetical protein